MVLRLGAVLALPIAIAAGGCPDGTVEVVLVQPTAEDARPVTPARVVVTAERDDGSEEVRTATVRDGSFDLGTLPIADYHAVSARLESATGAVLGFGQVDGALAVDDSGTTTVTIPVRRPRSYVAGPAPGATLDGPLTAAQGSVVRVDRGGDAVLAESIPLPSPAAITASAGADLFVASGNVILRLDTATDTFDGDPIADLGTAIFDLAGSADGTMLVAGTANGLHVIDLASRAVTTFDVGGRADVVTTGVDPDGATVAVALRSPAVTCPGSTMLAIARPADGELAVRMIPAPGLRDVAGVPGRPLLVGAGFCQNQAVVVDLGADDLDEIGPVQAPTAAVADRHTGYVVGSTPATLGTLPDPDDSPPDSEEYTKVGTHHQLAVVDLDAMSARTIDLPPIALSVFTREDAVGSIAQVVKAKLAVAAAVTLSATGEQLVVTSNSTYRLPSLFVDVLGTPQPVFPPMTVHATHVYGISTQNGAVESTTRVRCHVCERDDDDELNGLGASCGTPEYEWLYENWACSPIAGGELQGDFEAGSAATLYGRS
ncbi:MAG TPA: hypothetical protein VHE35_02655 [Kofleriaceae bacterium]|nr:hypothetical protein [Kofleriaceae bacterium]